jgi:hypothetical protein
MPTGEATTGAKDAAGMFTTQTTYASSRCLFGDAKGGVRVSDSGQRVQQLPSVQLPATTAIAEGQVLEGLATGLEKTYQVVHVRPVVRRNAIDHLRCDLEVTT